MQASLSASANRMCSPFSTRERGTLRGQHHGAVVDCRCPVARGPSGPATLVLARHQSCHQRLQMMSKDLPVSAVMVTPPRRCQRPRAILSAPVWWSMRLAKKAISRPPTVVAAQNLLMRKLGITSRSSVETRDFNCYIKTFVEGLSLEQANLIDEIFMVSVPAPNQVDEESVQALSVGHASHLIASNGTRQHPNMERERAQFWHAPRCLSQLGHL
jgi:hypothetical protein